MALPMATDHSIAALYRYVGRQISDRRRGRYTQGQLASVLGISRTSVTNLERGRQRAPLHYLLQIAEALGCEIADLLPSHSQLGASSGSIESVEVVGTLTPTVRAIIQRYSKRSEVLP